MLIEQFKNFQPLCGGDVDLGKDVLVGGTKAEHLIMRLEVQDVVKQYANRVIALLKKNAFDDF